MAKLSIHTDEKKSKINRNIYGNFSEHLGRCIYNGIYVGRKQRHSKRKRHANRYCGSAESY